ncbi:MAG: family 43 glycosylhydrolase [Bacteroidetes bacterium]|nr:family 43 glycosylhydrolase [Bacteroidota bacterium]
MKNNFLLTVAAPSTKLNVERLQRGVISTTKYFFLVLVLLITGLTKSASQTVHNPLFGGFYAADPTIIRYHGYYYIYATIDPWGGDELAVFQTRDFIHFKQKHINWPNKKSCTSANSGDAKVWAPSVVERRGKFYMYVSVGSEIWAGVSDHPLGPWKSLLPEHIPLVSRNYMPGYHMIDAECFIDDDGIAYLYWGSGLNWVNGKCFCVKLKEDMHSFDGKPADITPPNYFEAPFMLKHEGKYYLMYSNGKAIDSTYNIRYSIGKTPMGPWIEGHSSPVIQTTGDRKVYGPGHHTVFRVKGQAYILYHKIFPQEKQYVLRQLCIDSLNFDDHGNIEKVKFHDSIRLMPNVQ